MTEHPVTIPIQRSTVRRRLGRTWYTTKRKIQWHRNRDSYATRQTATPYPFSVVEHKSVLLRKLKDVEMWLQHNKVTNLRMAIGPLYGLIIQPRETFSFWYRVGNPSKGRGFLPGMVLVDGQVRHGYGGGLCQLANLIYWMALHTPLTVTERWRHSYDVFPDVKRTLPFGSGATVAYNYIDLQLRNDTEEPFQLLLWLTDTHLHGEIRSTSQSDLMYEVFERNHQFRGPHSGVYSRHNEIYRKVFARKTRELLQEEFITENHALMMYAPLLSEANTGRKENGVDR